MPYYDFGPENGGIQPISDEAAAGLPANLLLEKNPSGGFIRKDFLGYAPQQGNQQFDDLYRQLQQMGVTNSMAPPSSIQTGPNEGYVVEWNPAPGMTPNQQGGMEQYTPPPGWTPTIANAHKVDDWAAAVQAANNGGLLADYPIAPMLPFMFAAGAGALGGTAGAAEAATAAEAADAAATYGTFEGMTGAGSLGEAVAGTTGATAGSGAMDLPWQSLIGEGGDVNAAIEAIQNSGMSLEQQIQAMQGVNNAASGGEWTSFLNSGALGDPSTSLSLMQNLQSMGLTPSNAVNAAKTLFGGSSPDLMKTLGSLGTAGLNAYASNQQTNALSDMAKRYEGYGAPYRQKLSDLYADPTAFLQSKEVQTPVNLGTQSLMRSLSTQGNPFGSGNALTEGQNYASNKLFSRLGEEKDRLAGFGGLASYNAAAPQASTNAISSGQGPYIGAAKAMGDIFNPPQTQAQTMAEFYKAMGR